MASRAKAHHEALNSAYATYYAPGTSTNPTPTSSTETSRSSSIAMLSSTTQQHTQKPTNASKAWSAIKKHHREMNEAYTVFYSPGVASSPTSPNSSAVSSPRQSAEHQAPRHELASELPPRNATKVWKALKNRVVEHHKSVNSAYAKTYGLH
ncbi:hypothetical protein LEMA_P039910.1 [Plenodomus lingam JN3]|uniref:Uncharacterized protein n=2 Tax=Leptosphaeria maculans TaxID=5022 RepID=E4ZP65_LEPMJ|nr:hypothetical protein LEMA_P039910.1 [Plenodomus lingam JN3]CBX93090.1 hypothetical protein LEMA_P039910.1 [Plenodomus lingam JN3]